MEDRSMELTYKIFMEAEDISMNRIISSTSFVKNLLINCNNAYFKESEIDDENNLDESILCIGIEKELKEENCTNPQDARTFLGDMAELLDRLAQAQSYMNIEGNFSIRYDDIDKSYSFVSEQGQDYCEFTEFTENA